MWSRSFSEFCGYQIPYSGFIGKWKAVATAQETYVANYGRNSTHHPPCRLFASQSLINKESSWSVSWMKGIKRHRCFLYSVHLSTRQRVPAGFFGRAATTFSLSVSFFTIFSYSSCSFVPLFSLSIFHTRSFNTTTTTTPPFIFSLFHHVQLFIQAFEGPLS